MLFNQNFSFHPAGSVKTCGSVASTVPIKTHQTIRKPFSLQFLSFLSFDSFYVKLESLSLHFILYFVLIQRKNKSLKKRKTEGEKNV